MVNATEREALAQVLVEASPNLPLSNARQMISNYLPKFVDLINQHDGKQFTVDTFELQPQNKAVANIVALTQKENNLPMNVQFLKQNYWKQQDYKKNFWGKTHAIAREKHANRIPMGDELQNVLANYTTQQKLQTIKDRYVAKNSQIKPIANKDNPKAVAEYQQYLLGVKRANDILDYLNKRKINTSIDVDDVNDNQLAVKLPEYQDTKIILMSDDPRQIGKVNTWKNNIAFGKNVDPLKYNAATLIDTVVNPTTKTKFGYSFKNNSNREWQTVINRQDMPDTEIFVTSNKHGARSMEKFTSEVKNRQSNISTDLMKEFADATGLDDEDDDTLGITQQDKDETVAKRKTPDSDFKPIVTPEEIAHERQNKGLYTAIKTQAESFGMDNVTISKNSKGVYRYDYTVKDKNQRMKHGYGIIGGYIPPEKDGSFKIEINGKLKGYSVPGMRAYIDSNSGDLKVKPFNRILYEKVRSSMMDQMLNPKARGSVQSYKALDSLYTTDSYSTMIQKGVNSPEYEKALVETLKKRVRLPDEILGQANAYNEDPNHVKQNLKNHEPQNKREEMLATMNLRTIPKEWQKVVDREMTGIGHTMGSSLFIGDDVKIDKQGNLIPQDGVEHTKSALHKLEIFNWDKYDPADRNIMAFNQAIRNNPVDTVNVAMMTMSGYTENDACVITKKYADKHKLVRGDKISDVHGNKSTISEVIDPDEQDPERRDKLKREIAIVKANPDLDVVVNPYSSISRLNAGSVREMQERGGMKQLNSPSEYPDIDLSHISMGKESYFVCEGQRVQKKTAVYDENSFNKGKARKYSHQLAGATAAADMPKLLNHVYKNNTNNGWAKFFDDLHVMGYDVDKQHNLGYFDYDNKDYPVIKIPTKEQAEKISTYDKRRRKEIDLNGDNPLSFKYRYEKAKLESKAKGNVPIVMEMPTEYTNAAGQKTNKIVIPVQQIQADDELAQKMGILDNSKTNVWMSQIKHIYNKASGIELDKENTYDENGKFTQIEKYNPKSTADLARKLTNSIMAHDFGKKKNVVKGEIYSAPMPDSSTAVITPDPTLDIDEIKVGPDVYDNLHLKDPDEKVIIWRDPILRQSGFKAMHVTKDPTLVGASINPVNDKSMDMDHDGDTIAVVPIHDPEVQKELEKKLPSKDLINYSTKKPESMLETGLEMQGSLHRQNLDKDAAIILNNPTQANPQDVRTVIKQAFDNDKAYGIGLDLTSKESYLKGVSDLIASGAKGHCERDENGNAKLDEDGYVKSDAMKQVEKYYDGKRSDADYHNTMIALSVKADGIGVAGAQQQKLLLAMRDINPNAAMEATAPITNGVAQAKHDGEKAKTKLIIVSNQIPNIINGNSANANQFNKYQLNRNRFVHEMLDTYNDDLGVSLNERVAQEVADGLSDENGTIMAPKDRLKQADPMDIIAYGNGSIVGNLNNIMKMNKKLATGKYSQHFVLPEKLCSDKVLGHDYSKDDSDLENNKTTDTIDTSNNNEYSYSEPELG